MGTEYKAENSMEIKGACVGYLDHITEQAIIGKPCSLLMILQSGPHLVMKEYHWKRIFLNNHPILCIVVNEDYSR